MQRSLLLIITLLAFGAFDAHAQESIRLRSSARVPADTPVTLASIAKLSAGDESALAGITIPVERGNAAWTTISADDVRRALEAAGTSRATYTLQGSSCAVRFTGTTPRTTTRTEPARPVPVPATARAGTVRERVETRIQSALDVEADQLRLTFSRSDVDLLDRAVGTDRVDVALTSTGGSRGLRLKVLIFEGARHDRLAVQETLTVQALVLRDVLRTTRRLQRDQPILSEDVTYARNWIDPGLEPLSRDDLTNVVASKSIGRDEILTRERVRKPVLIKRNQVIKVFYVGTGLTIEAEARALEDGRLGEMIQCRAIGAEAPFYARVDGRSRAVVSSVSAARGQADNQHQPETD